jgi:hypothetical protein
MAQLQDLFLGAGLGQISLPHSGMNGGDEPMAHGALAGLRGQLCPLDRGFCSFPPETTS